MPVTNGSVTRGGNIFLDLLGNICSRSAGPGIAKVLLQLSLQLTLVPQL